MNRFQGKSPLPLYLAKGILGRDRVDMNTRRLKLSNKYLFVKNQLINTELKLIANYNITKKKIKDNIRLKVHVSYKIYSTITLSFLVKKI